MTIGTLTLITLGALYSVWSFYSIMDILTCRYKTKPITDFWAFVNILIILYYGLQLAVFVGSNWDKPL